MRVIFIAILTCLSSMLVQAQQQEIPEAPIDPNLRYGVLENGLTYYILHNEEPKDRASFYIMQNVGALLENDEQNGLAHFLEHMAFNGLETYPGKEMLNFLAESGIEFGRDINAYTSFDETVYNISNVPTHRESLLDSCVMVLHDWSDGLLLTNEEIDNERGVISEEWRTRRDYNFRLRGQYFPVWFEGSMYAKRDVIGDLDVIKNFEYQTIKDFYHDWYRTDLQGIAIVGDFDVDRMEAHVKELFSTIPAIENPKVRETIEIPGHTEPRFVLATDEEAPTSSIMLSIIQPATPKEEKNVLYLRNSYANSLINSMIRSRISELLQKGTPPFINGSISYGDFFRGYATFMVNTTAKPNEEALAFSSILAELQRVLQHGFTQGELDRAKMNFLTRLESAYNDRDKISNDRHARALKNFYIDGEPFTTPEFDYQFAQQILPTISVEETSAMFKSYYKPENRTIIITGPEDPAITHLTKEEAFDIISKSENTAVEPYLDVAVATTLIEKELPSATLVSEKTLEDFDAKEWTLSNGTKVIYRFADDDKDDVTLSAYSPGGESILSTDQLKSSSMLGEFTNAYGVGEFDAVSLQKALTGKNVGVGVYLSELFEGVSGQTTPKDFETMMQLVYLKFMEPRFDANAHTALEGRYVSYLENMGNNPAKIMQDSVGMILSDYSERSFVFDAKSFEDISSEQIETIYRDRFADASDFTFFIVGNIEEAIAKEMAIKYIGAIQDTDRNETWVDHKVRQPKGEVKRNIEIEMTDPKATNMIFYLNETELSLKERLILKALNGILDLRYTEEVREKEGGTYGVGVRASYRTLPEPSASITMSFDCDPLKAEHLASIIHREIDKIINEGPLDSDVAKVKETMAKNREQSKAHNSYWMSTLQTYYKYGYNSNDPENYEDLLESITPKDVQKLTKKLTKKVEVTSITFLPKGE